MKRRIVLQTIFWFVFGSIGFIGLIVSIKAMLFSAPVTDFENGVTILFWAVLFGIVGSASISLIALIASMSIQSDADCLFDEKASLVKKALFAQRGPKGEFDTQSIEYNLKLFQDWVREYPEYVKEQEMLVKKKQEMLEKFEREFKKLH